jgi:transposase-like protein
MDADHHLAHDSAALRWKRHSPDEIIAKLQEAQALIDRGKSCLEVAAAIGVASATYFRWKREFGGLSMSQVARIKHLEVENARLRRAIAELESNDSLSTGPGI